MGEELPAATAARGVGVWSKVAIVVALVGAVAFALYLREARRPVEVGAVVAPAAPQAPTPPAAPAALPRLVDLGATRCIPCKMMAPILEELKVAYAGKFEVEFIDVWENPGAGEQYGVEMIPTQIFYDAFGKERFRHQGFFPKEDILAKWKELGVDLGASAGNT